MIRILQIVALLLPLSLLGQNVISVKNLHVHDIDTGDGIAVHQHKVFGIEQGILSTAKSKGADARVVFPKDGSWENASDLSHVDGFVTSHHLTPFTFPVGSDGRYKPVSLSNPKAATAAYFTNDSSFDVVDSNRPQLLNSSEYWVIQGQNPTHVTLTWDQGANMTTITGGDLSKVSILGFDGSQWTVIPSQVDRNVLDTTSSKVIYTENPSALMGGSISTTEMITPDSYIAYAIGTTESLETINAIVEAEAETTRIGDINNYEKIRSVHFPFKEYQITRYSTNLLHRLARQLEGKNPRIRLVGHADFYGSSSFNYELGMNRANAVKELLQSLGVETIEIEVVSKGEDALQMHCPEEDCHSRETLIDRRVDIYVYKG
ncbi:MAG: OmpA family protein [Flavobacteriaceae bacterium]|nr:OmpA family protein [Flavobacteriaceae bacterium]